MDKMREEFESAWKSARISERYSSEHMQVELDSFYLERNKYGYSDIQEAWFFWQASRKALVVELPASWNASYTDKTIVMDASSVVEALEDAGVAYK